MAVSYFFIFESHIYMKQTEKSEETFDLSKLNAS